jgi:hypothetical protein
MIGFTACNTGDLILDRIDDDDTCRTCDDGDDDLCGDTDLDLRTLTTLLLS